MNAIVDVLRSDWLTQGPTVPKFEKSVASRAKLWGWGKVIYFGPPPNTFVASANCGLYCGAKVDRSYWKLCDAA